MEKKPLHWVSKKTGKIYNYYEYDNNDTGLGSTLRKNLPRDEYPYLLIFEDAVEDEKTTNLTHLVEARLNDSTVLDYVIYGDTSTSLNGIIIQGTWKEAIEKLKEYRKISPQIGIGIK